MTMLSKDIKNLIKIWDEELVGRHIHKEIGYLQEYFSNKTNLSYVDIGANVGKFYDVLSEFYQLDNVYMVEPAPQLFEYITEKFKNTPHCKLYDLVISNKDGETNFQTQCIDNSTLEYIDMGVSKIHNDGGYHLLKMISGFNFLTNYVDDLEKIDFIKIDTETHDYLILESITPIIEKLEKKPFLLFEHNYHNLMSDDEAEKILNEFTSRCQYESIDFKSLSGDCFIKPK